MIKKQAENYIKEHDRITKTKISQNVAYLIQTQSSLIRDEKQIEERITRLEQQAGLSKEK